MTTPHEIKSAIDVVELIGRYVKLKRAGRNHSGCCPFHDDRTPSFVVYPDGRFHCFGCGAHGDVIDFVRRVEGVDFVPACRLICGWNGLDPYAPEHLHNRGPRLKLVQSELEAYARYLGGMRELYLDKLSGVRFEAKACMLFIERGDERLASGEGDRDSIRAHVELLTATLADLRLQAESIEEALDVLDFAPEEHVGSFLRLYHSDSTVRKLCQ